jgi:hypothetical protein
MDLLYVVFTTLIIGRWVDKLKKDYGDEVELIPTFEFFSFAIASIGHGIITFLLVVYNIIEVVLMFMGK